MRGPGLLCAFLLILECLQPALGQDSLDVERFLQELETESVGETDLLLQVEALRRKPIALNQAGVEELLDIPFLEVAEAEAIVTYRKRHGPFRSLSQLDSVAGLPRTLLPLIKPLLTLRLPRLGPSLEYRVRTSRRLNRVAGFQQGILHNPLDVYQRLDWRPHPDWQLHLIWQKDAGETNWFDYGSLALHYRRSGFPLELFAGDFHLRWAQQLLFGPAYGTPLAVEQLSTFWPPPTRLLANTAAQESVFLRGVAGEFRVGEFLRLGTLASWRRLDGRLREDSLTVGSFDLSGFHRTPTEQSRRKNTAEQVSAVWLRSATPRWSAGILAAGMRFNRPVLRLADTLVGQQLFLSAFLKQNGPMFATALELVLQNGRYPAFQQTSKLNIGLFTYWLSTYYAHPRYWSFHGRALDEIQKNPGNEKGAALGVQARLPGRVTFAFLVRKERTIRSFDTFPRNQTCLQVLGRWQAPGTQLTVRYTYRMRIEDRPVGVDSILHIHRLRAELVEKPVSNLRLRQRVELSWTHPRVPAENAFGFATFSEVTWRPDHRWKLQLRWTQFQVPAFPYALFEYEPDVPGTFRVALLNGRGYKWFVLLSARLTPSVQLHIKYRLEYFPEAAMVGQGLAAVQGNRRRELRIQLELRE